MPRQRSLVFALTMLTALAISGAAPSPARAQDEAKVCGIIGAHVPAIGLLPGILTVGSTAFAIAPGASVGSAVAVGANLCFDLTLNLSGEITDAAVVANVSSALAICGRVTGYAAATAIGPGSLTIDGATWVVAIGATMPPSMNVGADLCITLTLNGHGQIAAAAARANVTSILDLCGVVDGYVASTTTTNGSLAIAGRTLVVAIRASMPASVTVGADLCLRLTLNGFGQVSNVTTHANLSSTLEVCGQVNALTAATSAGNGSMAIGGTTHLVAAGTTLPSSITVNAYLKLRLLLDGFMRITDAAVLKVGVSAAEACASSTTLIPTPPTLGSPGPDSNTVATGSPGPSGSAGPRRLEDATIPGSNGLSRPSGRPDASAETQTAPKNLGGAGVRAEDGTPVDSGQIVPDTASLGRAGMAILQVSLPLMLLLVGLLARELVLRSRRLAAVRHPDVGVPKA